MLSYGKLKHTPLFQGMLEFEAREILVCLSPRHKHYAKGDVLFQAGDIIKDIGLVLTGSIHLTKEDYWGNQALLARIGEYELFGETFACLQEALPFTILATEESEVLFFHVDRILTSCSSACRYHQRLIRNLLTLSSEKNLQLAQKIDLLSQRTIRNKLLTYLSEEARKRQAISFNIPFTRQQLADYLSVDRSAMTVELGKLAKAGIIRFERNHFELL